MMNDYKITNKFLTVTVTETGAELTSVKANNGGYEYLWQADPKIWKRHAPILFPNVGRLKDDSYTFNGVKYHLPQHGFARDMKWDLIDKSSSKLIFQLESNEDTLSKYPFKFVLQAVYELKNFELKVNYIVKNTDNKKMIFSIGGHPAFNANFKNTSISANQREFDRYTLNGNYLNPSPIGKINFSYAHKISRSDFLNDALILKADKDLTELFLQTNVPDSESDEKQLERSTRIAVAGKNLKFFGIWSKNDEKADFVAIEPWWGVADTINSNQRLENKFGSNSLSAGQKENFEYSMSFL
ncbi:putative galactose mutarotase [Oenococcus oeni]|nr:aldose 1-epimerase family protein [Oenococcus oeni]KEP87371.1 galactose mutarotase [Oenococcus oeni IOEB_0501]SYW01564.1 putative galactose mutarotase [Oenococcus oeni]SYW06864.1 putative galactose mutarotase [Oenococcus oeni]SYW09755.1 putative galactose mutarotase [Oenococcus oeni]SYW11045.1 putative galactose mutarotase [Oenococcus oeni]